MGEIVQRQKSGLGVSLPLSVNDVGGMLAALNVRKFMENPAYKWIEIRIFSPGCRGGYINGGPCRQVGFELGIVT